MPLEINGSPLSEGNPEDDNEPINISKSLDLKIAQFTKETVTDKENVVSLEDTLTVIIEDLKDLKGESKSTQKGLFLLKRDILQIHNLLLKERY